MKKYATWEMIKALEENPKLKFKNIKNGYEVIVGDDGVIKTDEGRNFLIVHVFYNNDGQKPVEWELIQQPVSFMEAVKAYHEGKNVYCLSGPTRYDYMPHDESITGGYLFSCLSTGEMINGIWYIWED